MNCHNLYYHSMKPGLLLAVFGLALTFLPFATFGEEGATRAAWEKAQDSSLENKELVVFAVSGRTRDATSHQLGEKIQKILLTQNIKTKFYTEDEAHFGAAISFYIDGVQYGPKGLSKIGPVMREVAHDFKEAH